MTIVLHFDVFELDTQTLELRRAGVTVRLRPQPARLLRFLAERPGMLVTREEIRTQLWPAGTFVRFDQGLNSCMKQVRAALGDRPERPRFIETLPRRGYRFLPSVSETIAAAPGVRRARLAVLPFEAIDITASAVAPLRLVGERFAESLIARLTTAGSDGIAVLSGPTAEGRWTAADFDTRDADYIVAGSVRRVEGRLHVTARLISVPDRSYVWTGSSEHAASPMLLWQDEAASTIAEAILRALRIESIS